jgi:hypothetical protein
LKVIPNYYSKAISDASTTLGSRLMYWKFSKMCIPRARSPLDTNILLISYFHKNGYDPTVVYALIEKRRENEKPDVHEFLYIIKNKYIY